MHGDTQAMWAAGVLALGSAAMLAALLALRLRAAGEPLSRLFRRRAA